jgi:hypothetical protein
MPLIRKTAEEILGCQFSAANRLNPSTILSKQLQVILHAIDLLSRESKQPK